MSIMHYIPATPAQIGYITDLLADRDVPSPSAEKVREMLAGPLSKSSASHVIDTLKAWPKRARVVAGAAPARPNVLVDLDVPKSRYAIPAIDLELEALDVNLSGELFFVEVKEYRGTTYMRQLVGAPGSFNRLRLSPRDVVKIANVIMRDAYGYTRLFGENYSCCGKCGAELTDDESRRLMLGPICRKAFGF